MNVEYLVLRDTYNGFVEPTVLVLSKVNKESFDPEEAAVELVMMAEVSLESDYHNKSFLPRWDHVHSCIKKAYWGENYGIEWHEDTMDTYGWTHLDLPTNRERMHIVDEDAVKWMFDCFEKAHPDWKEERKNDLRKSALLKLTLEDKKVLGLIEESHS